MPELILDSLVNSLSDKDVISQVGNGAWALGCKDHQLGCVESLDFLEDEITGRVRGRGVTYTVRLRVQEDRLGMLCACLSGRNCQHSVALFLAARNQIGASAKGLQATSSQVLQLKWRKDLTGLIGGHKKEGHPLGLLVDAHDPSVKTSLIPLRLNNKNVWTAQRAAWSDLMATQWTSITDDLNSSHVTVLREGYVVATKKSSHSLPNEVFLESLGREAGPWLGQVQRAGIPLFASLDPLTPLVLDHRFFDVVIDARQDVNDGGVTLSAVLRDGEETITQARLDPQSALAFMDAGTRFGRIYNGLDILEVLSQSIHIPRTDLAEFYASWLSELSQSHPMISTDLSVDLDSTVNVDVVATVTVKNEGEFSIRWWVEQSIEESTLREPISAIKEDASIYPRLFHILKSLSIAFREGVALDKYHLYPSNAQDFPLWCAPSFLNDVVNSIQVPGFRWEIEQDVQNVRIHDEHLTVNLRIDQQDCDGISTDQEVSYESEEEGRKKSDWFDLVVTINIAGHQVELSQILQALARGDDYLLVDGMWVNLEGERIGYLRELFNQIRLTTGDLDALSEHTEGLGRVRIAATHAGIWDALESVADTTEVVGEWENQISTLRQSGDCVGLPVPTAMRVEMWPHQLKGHQWLTSLMSNNYGGILADDMGLGKTIQILASIASLRESVEGKKQKKNPPVLIIAPTSVVPTWLRESERFFPGLRVVVVSSTSKNGSNDIKSIISDTDVVIMTYTIARLEIEKLKSQHWSGLVLDEAQNVKNHLTATHGALRQIESDWVLAVSGTPIENSTSDLWSLFRLTNPSLLPDWPVFSSRIQQRIEKDGDSRRLLALQRLVSPFILRRTKEMVAPDLPPKVESILEVDLGVEHRAIYDEYLMRERSRILGMLEEEKNTHRMDILAALTRLRQLALDPALVDPEYGSIGSAKIDILEQHLEEILPVGHRVLVFSQFTSFLARIRARLERRGINVVQLDGSTRNRDAVVESFRKGEAPVFLISLKAGGTGLTLTEADYVFVMDPWWNPAVEAQAVDRAHRIGQERAVTVYRLVAQDTIEHKVLELQSRKRELVSSLLSPHDQAGDGREESTSLSQGRVSLDDLRELLS